MFNTVPHQSISYFQPLRASNAVGEPGAAPVENTRTLKNIFFMQFGMLVFLLMLIVALSVCFAQNYSFQAPSAPAITPSIPNTNSNENYKKSIEAIGQQSQELLKQQAAQALSKSAPTNAPPSAAPIPASPQTTIRTTPPAPPSSAPLPAPNTVVPATPLVSAPPAPPPMTNSTAPEATQTKVYTGFQGSQPTGTTTKSNQQTNTQWNIKY